MPVINSDADLISIEKFKGELDGEFTALWVAIDKNMQCYVTHNLELKQVGNTTRHDHSITRWKSISNETYSKYSEELHHVGTWKPLTKPLGSVISSLRAQEIANRWHGGQASPLYSFASSGSYIHEKYLDYMREILECKRITNDQKGKQDLDRLAGWFEFRFNEVEAGKLFPVGKFLASWPIQIAVDEQRNFFEHPSPVLSEDLYKSRQGWTPIDFDKIKTYANDLSYVPNIESYRLEFLLNELAEKKSLHQLNNTTMENKAVKPSEEITITGRLGGDPETRVVKDKHAEFMTFSVAVKAKDAPENDPPKWYDVSLNSMLMPYGKNLKKGSFVTIKGSLKENVTEKKTYYNVSATELLVRENTLLKGNVTANPTPKKVGDLNIVEFSIGLENEDKAFKKIVSFKDAATNVETLDLKKADFVSVVGFVNAKIDSYTPTGSTKEKMVVNEYVNLQSIKVLSRGADRAKGNEEAMSHAM